MSDEFDDINEENQEETEISPIRKKPEELVEYEARMERIRRAALAGLPPTAVDNTNQVAPIPETAVTQQPSAPPLANQVFEIEIGENGGKFRAKLPAEWIGDGAEGLSAMFAPGCGVSAEFGARCRVGRAGEPLKDALFVANAPVPSGGVITFFFLSGDG